MSGPSQGPGGQGNRNKMSFFFPKKKKKKAKKKREKERPKGRMSERKEFRNGKKMSEQEDIAEREKICWIQ